MAVLTSTLIGIAATATAAVGVGLSIHEAKKGTKAGKRANAALRAANRLKNKQAKRAFLRNFRQAQASTLVSAVAAGVGIDSSAFQGTLSSQKTQTRVALDEFAEADQLGTEFATAQSEQTSANTRSSRFGSIASFAQSFIGFKGFG